MVGVESRILLVRSNLWAGDVQCRKAQEKRYLFLVLLAHFLVVPFFAFVVILIAYDFALITRGRGRFVHLKMRFFQKIRMLLSMDGHKVIKRGDQI